MIWEPTPHLIGAFSPDGLLSLGFIYSCPPYLRGKVFRPIERLQSTHTPPPSTELTLSDVLAWITLMNGSSTNSIASSSSMSRQSIWCSKRNSSYQTITNFTNTQEGDIKKTKKRKCRPKTLRRKKPLWGVIQEGPEKYRFVDIRVFLEISWCNMTRNFLLYEITSTKSY